MQKPMRLINAEHRKKGDRSQPRGSYQDCAAVLKLCIGARVRLNCNLWVEAGLYNGASGTVIDIIDDPKNQLKNGLPICVLIQMDESYKGKNSCLDEIPRVIPICPKDICHKNSKIPFSRYRKQVPLSLDWARTLHKGQGLTLIKAIIDINHQGK